MKNDDILKKLNRESESITLPDSLKKENIVSSLQDRPNIQVLSKEGEKMTNSVKRRIASAVVSVAAAVAIIVGIAAIPGRTVIPQPAPQNNEKPVSAGDYSEIEKLISDYYMNNIYREETFLTKVFNSFGSGAKMYDGDMNGSVATAPESVYEASVGTSSSKDFGTTNIQVQGVDEADIIKNDGRYLYRISRNQLFIIDCADSKNMKKVYKADLFNSKEENVYYDCSQMFINGNKLVVIANESSHRQSPRTYNEEIAYDCCFTLSSNKTVFAVYDISNKSDIKKDFEYSVDGFYNSARMFKGKVLIVTNYSVPYYDVTGKDPETVSNAIAEISVPYIKTGEEESRVAAEDITIADREEPMNYTVAVMFSVDGGEKTVETTATLGNTDSIYCTDEYLFTASSHYSHYCRGESKYYEFDGVEYLTSTDIYMYDVSGNKAKYVTKTSVPGTCIGQFSMDSYNGYFRIALNAAFVNQKDENFVYVLDKDLNVVGKTESFGVDEQIRSVRFLGDVAYVVTFKQTDPLFVIDLSAPKAPKIAGEVKLPGFSEYLHPIGDGLVMGIGYGGDDEGIDGNGKVSLFDVSDKSNPKELSSYIVKLASISTDSKAFTTINSKKMYCVLANDYYENTLKTLVFSVDKGQLKLEFEIKAGTDINYYDARSTYIGDSLFVFGNSSLYSYSLINGSELDSLAL